MTGMHDLVVSYLSLPYHERVATQREFKFKEDNMFRSNQENDIAFMTFIKKNNLLLEFGTFVEGRIARAR